MTPAGQSERDESWSTDIRVGRILNAVFDRRARGETVDDGELLRKHPEIAEELRDSLRIVGSLDRRDTIEKLIQLGHLTRSADGDYVADFDPYRILEFIGEGGMGIVLRAYEPPLDRVGELRPGIGACSRPDNQLPGVASRVAHRKLCFE